MSVAKTATPEMAEDEIDLESLQAQIDLSMSFAQDLVSTWVSTKSSSTSRNQKLERELQEYIRRPPRLGVGASVPETVHSVTREAARLKGKLVGAKRQRGEEPAEPSKAVSDDDDDGESRGKAIRKKVKLDPFAARHGKKSTGLPVVHPVVAQKQTVDHPPMPSTNSIVNDESQSPSKKKKKKKKHREDEAVDEPSSEGLRMTVGSPLHTAEKTAGSAVHIQKQSGKSNELSGHETTVKEDAALQSPNQVERMLIANFSPTPSPRKAIHPELLKIPLLNLSGPVQDEEDSGPESPSTPKKKRKRRKKKKHLNSADGK